MTVVELEDLTLEFILRYEEEKVVSIPIKRIIRKGSPTTQAQYHTKEPKRRIIECWLNSSEKQLLYDIKHEVDWQPWRENGVVTSYVWIEKVEVRWDKPLNKNRPWFTRIYMIVYYGCGDFDPDDFDEEDFLVDWCE